MTYTRLTILHHVNEHSVQTIPFKFCLLRRLLVYLLKTAKYCSFLQKLILTNGNLFIPCRSSLAMYPWMGWTVLKLQIPHRISKHIVRQLVPADNWGILFFPFVSTRKCPSIGISSTSGLREKYFAALLIGRTNNTTFLFRCDFLLLACVIDEDDWMKWNFTSVCNVIRLCYIEYKEVFRKPPGHFLSRKQHGRLLHFI